MKNLVIVLGSLVVLLFISPRHAYADGCVAMAIVDTPAVEDATSILKKGQTRDEMSVFTVDSKSGKVLSYAQAGGYSFPADRLQLVNCHVVKSPIDPANVIPGVPDETAANGYDYSLKFNDTADNSNTIITDSIENQLSQAGLDDADAGNGANAYINEPGKACGQAVKMILQGNKEMVSVVENGGICQP